MDSIGQSDPMHDYDAQYRRLKAAGLPGWAGDQHERNALRMAETLQRLERDHFPKPPACVLELGCGNGMSWSHAMACGGYDVHGIDISEAAIAWAGFPARSARAASARCRGLPKNPSMS